MVRFLDEIVTHPGDVGQVAGPWNGHGTSESFQFSGGNHLGVLPIAGPRDEDRILVRRCSVEESTSVIILAEVEESCGSVDGGEVSTIE